MLAMSPSSLSFAPCMAPVVVDPLLANPDVAVNQDPARAAPGDAAGLAGAVCIVVAVVVASRAQWGRYGWRGGRSACAVGGATSCYFRRM